jgi:hypothetical protein
MTRATLTGVAILGNSAARDGGGVMVADGTTILNGCSFIMNAVPPGGRGSGGAWEDGSLQGLNTCFATPSRTFNLAR